MKLDFKLSNTFSFWDNLNKDLSNLSESQIVEQYNNMQYMNKIIISWKKFIDTDLTNYQIDLLLAVISHFIDINELKSLFIENNIYEALRNIISAQMRNNAYESDCDIRIFETIFYIVESLLESNQTSQLSSKDIIQFSDSLLQLLIADNSTMFSKISALETFMAIFNLLKEKSSEIIKLVNYTKINLLKLFFAKDFWMQSKILAFFVDFINSTEINLKNNCEEIAIFFNSKENKCIIDVDSIMELCKTDKYLEKSTEFLLSLNSKLGFGIMIVKLKSFEIDGDLNANSKSIVALGGSSICLKSNSNLTRIELSNIIDFNFDDDKLSFVFTALNGKLKTDSDHDVSERNFVSSLFFDVKSSYLAFYSEFSNKETRKLNKKNSIASTKPLGRTPPAIVNKTLKKTLKKTIKANKNIEARTPSPQKMPILAHISNSSNYKYSDKRRIDEDWENEETKVDSPIKQSKFNKKNDTEQWNNKNQPIVLDENEDDNIMKPPKINIKDRFSRYLPKPVSPPKNKFEATKISKNSRKDNLGDTTPIFRLLEEGNLSQFDEDNLNSLEQQIYDLKNNLFMHKTTKMQNVSTALQELYAKYQIEILSKIKTGMNYSEDLQVDEKIIDLLKVLKDDMNSFVESFKAGIVSFEKAIDTKKKMCQHNENLYDGIENNLAKRSEEVFDSSNKLLEDLKRNIKNIRESIK